MEDMFLKLRDYQLEAVEFLREGCGGKALFLDMGLGKTATCLSALQPRHLPALVIAPKRVAENVWETEAGIWRPDLSVTVVKGDRAKRERLAGAKTDLVVVSRDNQDGLLSRAVTGGFKTVIIDELSGYKNYRTSRWRGARSLVSRAEHVWGLTGTPTPKSLVDLWAQMFLLDWGESLGKTIGEYRRKYFYAAAQLPNKIVTKWATRNGERTEKEIYDAIAGRALVQGTEGRVKLPPVTYVPQMVSLPGKVKKQYRVMKEEMVLRLIESGEEITAKNAAVVSGKLAQITAGFLYHDAVEGVDAGVGRGLPGGSGERKWDVLHKVKMDKLEDIIEGTNGGGVLVFYRFQAELEELKKRFGDDVHTVKEKDFVERWNAGDIPILAAHPDSIGHGLNLQKGGNTAVWLSLPWSSEAWLQSNKRLARSGQEYPVNIHMIMAEDSIDGRVYDSLMGKVDAQQRLLDYLKEEG
nr:MAG TPA: Chromatin remodeling complex ATPase [Caudoviricetes sp.]